MPCALFSNMNTENSIAADTRSLRVTEIFFSIQGESRSAGIPTVFVRLTGCPLRCGYCDTEYAFSGGETMTIGDIIREVKKHPAQYVTVTGGEPLAQKDCLCLLTRLRDAGYTVSLETSGALDVSGVDTRITKVIDFKTPGSGELDRNRFENVKYLNPIDQVKFVVCDRNDYEWAKGVMHKYELTSRCEVLMSPSHGQLAPARLAEWILADGLPVRLQLQLHKLIWGDVPGR